MIGRSGRDFFSCDTEQLLNKLKFFQHMLRVFGLDIIEDEMFTQLEKYSQLYQENKDR